MGVLGSAGRSLAACLKEAPVRLRIAFAACIALTVGFFVELAMLNLVKQGWNAFGEVLVLSLLVQGISYYELFGLLRLSGKEAREIERSLNGGSEEAAAEKESFEKRAKTERFFGGTSLAKNLSLCAIVEIMVGWYIIQ